MVEVKDGMLHRVFLFDFSPRSKVLLMSFLSECATLRRCSDATKKMESDDFLSRQIQEMIKQRQVCCRCLILTKLSRKRMVPYNQTTDDKSTRNKIKVLVFMILTPHHALGPSSPTQSKLVCGSVNPSRRRMNVFSLSSR